MRHLRGCCGVLLLISTGCGVLEPATGSERDGMIYLRGGTYTMGSNEADAPCPDGVCHDPVTHKEHEVTVRGFWIDKTEVTNEQFAKFAEATGYKTEAEQIGTAPVFPPAGAGNSDLDRRPDVRGFKVVRGADWRHPEGPDSSISQRMNHPVVQVSWNDALAYARWAGKRLPTEAEWEYAARAGGQKFTYGCGNDLKKDGRWLVNIWQGEFPRENTGADGFLATAPAGTFPANAIGLHDMAGNVWEWCGDWHDALYYAASPRDNPQGPDVGHCKVQRGGSWRCADDFCRGFKVSARQSTTPDSCHNHCGFRCVKAP